MLVKVVYIYHNFRLINNSKNLRCNIEKNYDILERVSLMMIPHKNIIVYKVLKWSAY